MFAMTSGGPRGGLPGQMLRSYRLCRCMGPEMLFAPGPAPGFELFLARGPAPGS